MDYLSYWKKQIKEREQKERIQREKNIRKLEEIKKVLCHYDVKKIIVFGSLIEREKFRLNSDIDIGVEGLKDENFFKAYAELIDKIDVKIDMISIENIDGVFKEKVLQGKVLYEEGRD